MLFLGKAWRPGAPKFRTKFDHSAIAAVQKRRAVRWHGAIPCKWATAAGRLLCNDTKKPWQNPILPRPMFPCSICVLRRPRITKSSGLCSRAQTIKIKSTPRAASYLLMGSRPQWPPFGAKPHNCKYSYGVSPGLSPGSFYPRATQRSSARRVIQCIIFLFTIYHIYRTLSTFFSHPTTKDTAAAGASPQAAAARAFYPMLRYFTSMIWISAS